MVKQELGNNQKILANINKKTEQSDEERWNQVQE